MPENIRNKINWRPITGNSLKEYLKPTLPPIDKEKLVLDFLVGKEREIIKRTHTTGDFSLLLSYKNTPAIVTSLEIANETVNLLQLQGINGKASFRVATGVDYVRLFANTLINIVQNPSLSFSRLAMPSPWSIPGICNEFGQVEADISKYIKFAALAGLSKTEEHNYVKEF